MTNNKLIIKLVFLMTLICTQSFAQTPADLLNQWTSNTVDGVTYDHCKQWKITYPTGDEDKDLCNAGSNEFYYVNSTGDGIVFKAPIRSNNGTTPNSDNIRSELREREVDNGSDIYWSTQGYHAIYVKQAITHLPINKNHLVATQIHGDKFAVPQIDDALVVRLEGTHLFLSFNGGKLRDDVTITNNYSLGTLHEVIFEVVDEKHYVYYSEDGNLKNAFLNGTASSYLVKDGNNEVLLDLFYDDAYFKVGNYTQSNPEDEGSDTDDPNNYGEVVVYDMYVDHVGTPAVPAECDDTPTNISVVSVSETTANVSWNLESVVNHYKVRYAVAGSNNWVESGNITTGSYEITGLTSDVTYEWQVRAVCDNGSGSAYADGQGADFTPTLVTTCVATTPSNRTVSNVSETSATLNWAYDALMDHYNVRYRPLGTDTWTTLTSLRESEGEFTVSQGIASMDLTGLTIDTEYEWQVRAKCADGSANEYADGQGDNFTTGTTVIVGCVATTPSNRTTSDISETGVTFNWSFDTEMDHYNLRYRPTGTATWTTLTSLRESEGEFTVSQGIASMDLTGLTIDTEYEWQVRAKCADGSANEYADGQGDNFTTSTTVIIGCVATAPSNRTVNDISETGVTFNWSFDAEMDHYNLRYRPTGTDTWTTLTSLRESEGDITVSNSVASIAVSNLTSNTEYEWQVRAKCADGSANEYADGQGNNFSTSGTETSLVPADLLNLWNSNTADGETYDHCKQWKITYPTGDEDKDLCNAGSNEFYYVNSTEDGIVFKAPIRSNNGTTPNSDNIRSELREREVDNGSDIYWSTQGYHAIYVKQAITHLPINKNHLVATQIHGDKFAVPQIDDALVVRLEGTHLFLSFNGGKLRDDVTITNNYSLGTLHEVIFEVIDGKHYVYYSEDGSLKDAFLNGTASSYLVKDGNNEVLMDLFYDDAYFKVGNYTQSNPEDEGSDTDDPNNYGEVVVYDMYVDHTAPVVTSIGSSELEFQLTISPNPAQDVVNVLNANGSILEVYNSNGALETSTSISSDNETIKLSDLSTGVYILKFTNDSGTAVKRLIKE